MADVALSGVGRRYGGHVVLRDVDLEVKDGEFLTLLGPSGCGKSTLLRIIAGLDRDYSGVVSIAGQPVDGLKPKERDVAMVFQSYALYPHMTVERNIGLPLTMRRLSAWQRLPLVGALSPSARTTRAAIQSDVRKVAAALEIAAYLDRKPGQLSGGQRQRVALARAMVRHPAVFLMDEPLSNLDAKLRVQTRAEIAALHRRLGATFIYVTHDQAEAMTMSARVAVMSEGRILQVGRPYEIYAAPANTTVARFVGTPRMNLMSGIVRDGGAVDVSGASLRIQVPRAEGEVVTVGFRPEGARISPRAEPGCFAGRIRLAEHMGSDVFVQVDVPGHADGVVLRCSPDDHADLSLDRVVHVSIESRHVRVFDANGQCMSSDCNLAPALKVRA
ncbi:ABC transporter ATP-binding protein [Microbacteriaceae bacterium K1510]|nr:ABC transporter ATP-binding protein [Microbacteriaceae bacterium K1510]